MKNNDRSFREPQPLNAEEFMLAVVAATPDIMRDINGVVNVDMLLPLDETGHIVAAEVVRCNTIMGKPVKPDEPEIVAAAQRVVRTLRFRPAMREGIPVRRDGMDMSFGFTTKALDTIASLVAASRQRQPIDREWH